MAFNISPKKFEKTLLDSLNISSSSDEECIKHCVTRTMESKVDCQLFDEDVHRLSMKLDNLLVTKSHKKKSMKGNKAKKFTEIDFVKIIPDSQANPANLSYDSSSSLSSYSSGSNCDSDVHELSSMLDSVLKKNKPRKKISKKKSKMESKMETIQESFLGFAEDSEKPFKSGSFKKNTSTVICRELNQSSNDVSSELEDHPIESQSYTNLCINAKFDFQKNSFVESQFVETQINKDRSSIIDMSSHKEEGNNIQDDLLLPKNDSYIRDLKFQNRKHTLGTTLQSFIMDSEEDTSLHESGYVDSLTSESSIGEYNVSIQASLESDNLSQDEMSGDSRNNIQNVSLQVSVKSDQSLDLGLSESEKPSNRAADVSDICIRTEELEDNDTSISNQYLLSNELDISAATSCSSVENSCLYKTALDSFPLRKSLETSIHSTKAQNTASRMLQDHIKDHKHILTTQRNYVDPINSSDSDDNFENFLEKVREPQDFVTRKEDSSIDDFIVSDNDSEEDNAFYITANRAILTSDIEDSSGCDVDESTDSLNNSCNLQPLEHDKENLFAAKNSETKFLDLSDESDDDFISSFKTPKPSDKNKMAQYRENMCTPERPLPSLHAKTAPARYPFVVRQENNNFTNSASHQCNFLKSLSSDIPDYQRHHDATRYVKSFKKHKEELGARLYKLFNATVFENQLPEDLLIIWNSRLLKTAGYCAYVRSKQVSGKRTARIELSTKVCDSAERLRDTLIHEICHAAVWLLCGANDGHGPYWKLYAKKATRIHPELPVIMRCHNYDINHKFIYKCSGCQYEIGRHSKSLDTKSKVCGLCSSPFELHVTSKTGVLTPHKTTPRTPNPFALFVKENYGSIKKQNKGISHKNVMTQLSKDFSTKNKLT